MATEEERLRYEQARRDLQNSIQRKRQIDKGLVRIQFYSLIYSLFIVSRQADLEVKLYNLETQYLTDTSAHSGGNIITGFENYLKNQSSNRRKTEAQESERIFSNSSVTYKKVCAFMLFPVLQFIGISVIGNGRGGNAGPRRRV
jgi:chromatin modification-related protein EAF6